MKRDVFEGLLKRVKTGETFNDFDAKSMTRRQKMRLVQARTNYLADKPEPLTGTEYMQFCFGAMLVLGGH